jgi:hypothetical protein
VAVTLRMQPDTRAALEQAIKKKPGRMLSQEVEHRLRQSFKMEDSVQEYFGSKRNYAVIKIIWAAIEETVNLKNPGGDWLSDPYLFAQAERAIAAALDRLRPEGAVPEDQLAHGGARQGEARVHELIRAAQVADPAIPLHRVSQKDILAHRLRDDIPDLIDRMKPWGHSAAHHREMEKLTGKMGKLIRKFVRAPETLTPEEHELIREFAARSERANGSK